MASFNSRRRPQTKAMAQQLKELDDEYEEEHEGYHRMESLETLNVHGDEISSDEDNIESLENPDIYFGEKAKDKFWDFYKSERRFKDFNK